MLIETNRLLLIPLNIEQLKMLHIDKCKMAEDIGCSAKNVKLKKHVVLAYKYKIDFMERNTNMIYIITCWQVVLKSNRTIVAEVTTNGMPDNNRIEVAYSTEMDFQNNGFMTEALKSYIKWMFNQNDYFIKTVSALVDTKNFSSIKVLKKSGLSILNEKYNLQLWGINNKNQVEIT